MSEELDRLSSANLELNLRETLSRINKFRPKYPSTNYPHPAEACLKEIIEDVLWDRTGLYEDSSSSCSPVSSKGRKMQMLYYETTEQKLRNWRNYLEDRRVLSERIMERTGKDYCHLLLNSINEHRRIELVKRILDYAERLRPEKLKERRERITTLGNTCPGAMAVYETLPTTEKMGKPSFPLIDVTKRILEEQGLEHCTLRKWSWLKSKYLAERLFCKAEDIRRIISYFPDFMNLEMLGGSVQETRNVEFNIDMTTEPGTIDFEIDEVDIGEKEKRHDFALAIDDFFLDVDEPMEANLEFSITCESSPYKKQNAVMFQIRNGGWKTVDFSWEKVELKSSPFIEHNLPPAFYFDTNDFLLIPGQYIEFPVMFCTKENGIYNETWILHSTPSFLKPNKNIFIYLIGHCKPDSYDDAIFNKLRQSYQRISIRNFTYGIVDTVALQAVPDPPPQVPYIKFFTEREIFTNLYPNMNYLQAEMEQLKKIYREANIATSCRCCPEWNYDLENLKQQILSIDESEKRKTLYFKLIDIIHRMRGAPEQSKSVYEDQKFFLVKSIIIFTLDKIDKIVTNLSEATRVPSLPLEFDEVLIIDRFRKPKHIAPPNSVSESCILSNPINLVDEIVEEEYAILEEPLVESATSSSFVNVDDVVKSEYIRCKQKQIHRDALYLQFFAHLGNAAEEIAAVIEGMRNLF